MRSLWTHSALVGAGLLMAACTNQTTVQQDYVAHRDDCQLYAEGSIGRYMDPADADIRTRNAKLVTLFSDCMFERGWTVATPEREGEEDVALEDDLPPLNDVPAGATAATAPAATAPATASQIPLDPNRRAPSQQYQ